MLGDQITQAIAIQWENIQNALGAKLGEFETKLLPLLRKMEENPADEGAKAAIRKLFEEYPPAAQLLRPGMERTMAHLTKAPGVSLIQERYRYAQVPVYFGTSRQASGRSDPADFFGSERASNSFGVAKVSIPDDHRMGEIERPKWFKLEFRENPEKHVVLLSVESMERAEFARRARAETAGAASREVLIFLHGFNVSFENAARRAGQFAYDLQFAGVPALYSWPSEGKVQDYLIDANNAAWAEPRFADFLKLVREELGAEVVHVVAHSMGNRLLASILGPNAAASGPGAARLRQIVFAAPDIDAGTFRDLAKAFPGKAERMTLYASSNDKALCASQTAQKYPRAGQSGMDLVIVPPIDTIDASAVKTDFLGHSYFAEGQSVLSDLFYLIRNGLGPGDRKLKKRQMYGNAYWELTP